MPGKTNGDKAVDNRINGTKDVEMKDESKQQPTKGKAAQQAKKLKESDEEMTVVVPSSKASKLAGTPQQDEDGDVQMDVDAVNDATETEKVDPVAKAVGGMYWT